MPPTIKKLGKVAASPFGALTKSTPAKKNNKPILILIVVGGVAVIWYLRNHSSANTVGSSTTNPAVSINGGNAPDQSTIDNLTASILALQGQVTNNPTVPSGGTSTPVTSSPSQTNPGTGTVTQGSGTANANDSFIASALASGAMVQTSTGAVQNPSVPYTNSQYQQLLTLIGPIQPHGTANGAAIPSTASTPAGNYTGVQGLSTSTGGQFLYQVFSNGKLVGSQVGPANQDTAALASKFGVSV